jgi:hypothetical protein
MVRKTRLGLWLVGISRDDFGQGIPEPSLGRNGRTELVGVSLEYGVTNSGRNDNYPVALDAKVAIGRTQVPVGIHDKR